MRLSIWAYNPGSESARKLADALGVKIIRHRASKYIWSIRKRVLNWGSTNNTNTTNWINHPRKVSNATNKLNAFRKFQEAGVRTPPWTTGRAQANSWVRDGKTVIARSILSGSEGRGIQVITHPAEVPQVPLYTQYVPKRAEFRVHVMKAGPGGAYEAIDIQKKVRKRSHENRDFHVRNTANGFVFIRNGFECPADCVDQSIAAVAALELDFGAVDVIWNERQGQAYVLEVNTAPGIEGTTVTKYKEALERLFAL